MEADSTEEVDRSFPYEVAIQDIAWDEITQMNLEGGIRVFGAEDVQAHPQYIEILTELREGGKVRIWVPWSKVYYVEKKEE